VRDAKEQTDRRSCWMAAQTTESTFRCISVIPVPMSLSALSFWCCAYCVSNRQDVTACISRYVSQGVSRLAVFISHVTRTIHQSLLHFPQHFIHSTPCPQLLWDS
jgi:hypothetical protein